MNWGIVNNARMKSMGYEGRYIRGEKWCRTCQGWKKWDGMFCPDCKIRLRTIPARKIFKERYKSLIKTK